MAFIRSHGILCLSFVAWMLCGEAMAFNWSNYESSLDTSSCGNCSIDEKHPCVVYTAESCESEEFDFLPMDEYADNPRNLEIQFSASRNAITMRISWQLSASATQKHLKGFMLQVRRGENDRRCYVFDFRRTSFNALDVMVKTPSLSYDCFGDYVQPRATYFAYVKALPLSPVKQYENTTKIAPAFPTTTTTTTTTSTTTATTTTTTTPTTAVPATTVATPTPTTAIETSPTVSSASAPSPLSEKWTADITLTPHASNRSMVLLLDDVPEGTGHVQCILHQRNEEVISQNVILLENQKTTHCVFEVDCKRGKGPFSALVKVSQFPASASCVCQGDTSDDSETQRCRECVRTQPASFPEDCKGTFGKEKVAGLCVVAVLVIAAVLALVFIYRDSAHRKPNVLLVADDDTPHDHKAAFCVAKLLRQHFPCHLHFYDFDITAWRSDPKAWLREKIQEADLVLILVNQASYQKLRGRDGGNFYLPLKKQENMNAVMDSVDLLKACPKETAVLRLSSTEECFNCSEFFPLATHFTLMDDLGGLYKQVNYHNAFLYRNLVTKHKVKDIIDDKFASKKGVKELMAAIEKLCQFRKDAPLWFWMHYQEDMPADSGVESGESNSEPFKFPQKTFYPPSWVDREGDDSTIGTGTIIRDIAKINDEFDYNLKTSEGPVFTIDIDDYQYKGDSISVGGYSV